MSELTEEIVTVQGVGLQIFKGGDQNKETLLVLHGINGPEHWNDLYDDLAQQYRVLIPSHPGFGKSELPSRMDSVEDISYVYLDLLDEMELENIHLLGISFGGWIAAEMAVKSCSKIKTLTLVDALGIKVSDRETRDITDIFVLSKEERKKVIFHDPQKGSAFFPDVNSLSEEDIREYYRNEQSALSLGWKPFMHNPKLIDRLHRIQVPTLVIWGKNDGVVKPEYGEVYAKAIPNSDFQLIEDAGHMPHIEKPEEFIHAFQAFTCNFA